MLKVHKRDARAGRMKYCVRDPLGRSGGRLVCNAIPTSCIQIIFWNRRQLRFWPLDQHPFSVNLFPQHEVAFPSINRLVNLSIEFELSCSCRGGCGRNCCGRGSLRDCCFNGCDEDCGGHMLFLRRRLCRWLLLCQILMSEYHHVWSAHRDHLLRFSSASLAFLVYCG